MMSLLHRGRPRNAAALTDGIESRGRGSVVAVSERGHGSRVLQSCPTGEQSGGARGREAFLALDGDDVVAVLLYLYR